jgi:hypothetical protein
LRYLSTHAISRIPEFVIVLVGKYYHKLHSRSYVTILTNEYIILDVGK